MKPRTLPCLVAAALAALATAPAAQAAPAKAQSAVAVCNQATAQSLGGDLATLPGDPLPPARFTTDLQAKPGKGVGLVNAASHSHALQVCAPAAVPTDAGGTTDPADGTGTDPGAGDGPGTGTGDGDVPIVTT